MLSNAVYSETLSHCAIETNMNKTQPYGREVPGTGVTNGVELQGGREGRGIEIGGEGR